jgi:hypothetical protein
MALDPSHAVPLGVSQNRVPDDRGGLSSNAGLMTFALGVGSAVSVDPNVAGRVVVDHFRRVPRVVVSVMGSTITAAVNGGVRARRRLGCVRV